MNVITVQVALLAIAQLSQPQFDDPPPVLQSTFGQQENSAGVASGARQGSARQGTADEFQMPSAIPPRGAAVGSVSSDDAPTPAAPPSSYSPFSDGRAPQERTRPERAPANRQTFQASSPTTPNSRPPAIRVAQQASAMMEAPSGGRSTGPSAADELVRYCTDEGLDVAADEGARRLTLIGILSGASPSMRGQIVQQYWRLSAATGRYRFAGSSYQFLNRLALPSLNYERAFLAAEQAAAQADVQKARLAMLEQQQRLVELAGSGPSTQLPWPVDAPLVGAYRTRFDTLFGAQSRPLRLQQIDQALPLRHERIELLANAIIATESAASTMLDEYEQGRITVEQLINVHRRLRQQQDEFLTAVQHYNQEIAEYALAVTGMNSAAETVVSTLIRTPSRDGLVPIASDTVQPATAQEPIGDSLRFRTNENGQRTAADDRNGGPVFRGIR